MTSRRSQYEPQTLSGPLEAYLQVSPDAMLAVDAHGRIRAANLLAGELFGYERAELAGLTIEDLVPERFRVAHAAQRHVYGQAPRYRRMGAGLDLWGRRKDGSEFPIDVSLAPQEGGRLVVAAVRDMTQRHREQAAAAQLATIITSSDDAIFSVTAQGTIASWNPGAEKLLRYPAAEVSGQPAALLLPRERSREFTTAMKRALSGDHVERFETWCACRDGNEVEVEATLAPLRDHAGQPAGVSVVLRDITERHLAELEAARARQHQQEMLVISDRERIARDLHDRVIQRIFAAGLTLQGTVAMTGSAAADRIDTVITELDAAIGEIRQTIFALEHGPVTAGSLRREVLDLAASTAGQLGHQASVDLRGPIDSVVTGEVADQLLAVLREALANVARHAHARATHIGLAASDSELVLQVSDDGVGISGATRSSGLANLRQRAHALGGSFAIGQPPAGGTRLRWRVPLRP